MTASKEVGEACGEADRLLMKFKYIKKTNSKYVNDKYIFFYKKNGYIPKFFDVYNGLEIEDFAPTITTRSNGAMGSGTLLVICDNPIKI